MSKTLSFSAWLQSRLTAHGFACGAIDGDIGLLTIAALKAFEASRGLTPDGTADPKVVEALRAPSSRVTPAVQAQLPDRDAEAKPGPAPAPSVANRWPVQAQVEATFGAPGARLTSIEIPFDMVLAWDKGLRAKRMSLNPAVAPSALRVLEKVAQIYTASERQALGLNLFGGAFNKRRMRGGSKWSMHAYGIAIDFDPERNQLNTHAPQARLSHADAKPFWAAWEAEGWLSLGRARDFDWMHVQAARL